MHLALDELAPIVEVEALVFAVRRRTLGLRGRSAARESARRRANADTNGPTNGTEPPMPISTGSVPKPSVSARTHAENAGPSGSHVHAGTASCTVMVGRSPNGTWASTCAVTVRATRSGS